MMRAAGRSLPLLALVLAGCAGRPTPPVAVVEPAPPVAFAPALPAGASPGMLVPQPLADGSFPTPNQALSAAGAVWHLRAGLNVAALTCAGEEGALIRAGYNRWLTTARRPLADAVTRYAAEYRVETRPGRAAYDDAMTRLYNFFAQTPVRAGLCAAAAGIVADLPSDAATLPGFAGPHLADLDRPYLAFYRDYDVWRRAAASRMTVAATTSLVTRGRAGLVLDTASLPLDPTETAAR